MKIVVVSIIVLCAASIGAKWGYHLGRAHGLRRAHALAHMIGTKILPAINPVSPEAARTAWRACSDSIMAAINKAR